MRKPHQLAHIVWLALSKQEVIDIHDVTSRLGDHGIVSSSYRRVAKDVLDHMHSQGLLKRVKRDGYRRSNTGFRQWLFNAERTKDPAGELIDYLAGDRRTLRRMPETFDDLNEFRAYLKKWGGAGAEMDAMSAEVWQRWQSHRDNEASECEYRQVMQAVRVAILDRAQFGWSDGQSKERWNLFAEEIARRISLANPNLANPNIDVVEELTVEHVMMAFIELMSEEDVNWRRKTEQAYREYRETLATTSQKRGGMTRHE